MGSDDREFCGDSLESHKDRCSWWVLLVWTKENQAQVETLKLGSRRQRPGKSFWPRLYTPIYLHKTYRISMALNRTVLFESNGMRCQTFLFVCLSTTFAAGLVSCWSVSLT